MGSDRGWGFHPLDVVGGAGYGPELWRFRICPEEHVMFRKFFRWAYRKDIRVTGAVCKSTVIGNWTRYYPSRFA